MASRKPLKLPPDRMSLPQSKLVYSPIKMQRLPSRPHTGLASERLLPLGARNVDGATKIDASALFSAHPSASVEMQQPIYPSNTASPAQHRAKLTNAASCRSASRIPVVSVDNTRAPGSQPVSGTTSTATSDSKRSGLSRIPVVSVDNTPAPGSRPVSRATCPPGSVRSGPSRIPIRISSCTSRPTSKALSASRIPVRIVSTTQRSGSWLKYTSATLARSGCSTPSLNSRSVSTSAKSMSLIPVRKDAVSPLAKSKSFSEIVCSRQNSVKSLKELADQIVRANRLADVCCDTAVEPLRRLARASNRSEDSEEERKLHRKSVFPRVTPITPTGSSFSAETSSRPSTTSAADSRHTLASVKSLKKLAGLIVRANRCLDSGCNTVVTPLSSLSWASERSDSSKKNKKLQRRSASPSFTPRPTNSPASITSAVDNRTASPFRTPLRSSSLSSETASSSLNAAPADKRQSTLKPLCRLAEKLQAVEISIKDVKQDNKTEGEWHYYSTQRAEKKTVLPPIKTPPQKEKDTPSLDSWYLTLPTSPNPNCSPVTLKKRSSLIPVPCKSSLAPVPRPMKKREGKSGIPVPLIPSCTTARKLSRGTGKPQGRKGRRQRGRDTNPMSRELTGQERLVMVDLIACIKSVSVEATLDLMSAVRQDEDTARMTEELKLLQQLEAEVEAKAKAEKEQEEATLHSLQELEKKLVNTENRRNSVDQELSDIVQTNLTVENEYETIEKYLILVQQRDNLNLKQDHEQNVIRYLEGELPVKPKPKPQPKPPKIVPRMTKNALRLKHENGRAVRVAERHNLLNRQIMPRKLPPIPANKSKPKLLQQKHSEPKIVPKPPQHKKHEPKLIPRPPKPQNFEPKPPQQKKNDQKRMATKPDPKDSNKRPPGSGKIDKKQKPPRPERKRK